MEKNIIPLLHASFRTQLISELKSRLELILLKAPLILVEPTILPNMEATANTAPVGDRWGRVAYRTA